ncbi:MAG: tRNA 2-thiouridine(34) synthase MnmA, partial [bacterium]|nr:tRNA 2-thiouridine(34) synthase MnmA [bacterium]
MFKLKKVVVGISGGVDSSVAAALLLEEGYEVIGLFMRNWDSLVNNDIKGNPTLNNDICTQEQDYNDAKKVCEKLGIELHRIDFVKEYYDYVFKYFLEELKKGRTPNPDVMCNRYIKFDLFVKEAKKLGADYIATGHYARMIDGMLYKAIDLNKDQTYFLAGVTKKQLENVLFPVGELTKDKVRKIAEKYDLITAHKKDSTGICFIGERNFKNFLENYLPNKPGDIINLDDNKK